MLAHLACSCCASGEIWPDPRHACLLRLMSTTRILTIAFVLLSALGCDKKAQSPDAKSPATLSKGDMKGPGAASAVADLPPGVDASVETNGLHVSDAIARACGLPKQETRASF